MKQWQGAAVIFVVVVVVTIQQTHLLRVGCALGGRPAERRGEMWHRQERRRSGTAAPRVQCMRSVCAACTQHALS